MKFSRGCCCSLESGEHDFALVYATIIEIGPKSITIEDSTGSIDIQIQGEIQLELNSCAYFLINCTTNPFFCERYTLVPQELGPVADYQLYTSSNWKENNGSCMVFILKRFKKLCIIRTFYGSSKSYVKSH